MFFSVAFAFVLFKEHTLAQQRHALGCRHRTPPRHSALLAMRVHDVYARDVDELAQLLL